MLLKPVGKALVWSFKESSTGQKPPWHGAKCLKERSDTDDDSIVVDSSVVKSSILKTAAKQGSWLEMSARS
jgi:hypothetical protein